MAISMFMGVAFSILTMTLVKSFISGVKLYKPWVPLRASCSCCHLQPFDKTNPYHLRKAFGDLDPAKLVRCYKRPLRFVRFEDEIEHPIKTNDDGVWFVKTAEVPPKILIRNVILVGIC